MEEVRLVYGNSLIRYVGPPARKHAEYGKPFRPNKEFCSWGWCNGEGTVGVALGALLDRATLHNGTKPRTE